ncbi:MAG: T9SS type A sorting domain-containing protein [Candidatus Hatepunaea meridiana]|nr:T9SS type A sorting domain-containing protein [Candidatus Hatepunaea meridiana]
MLKFKDVRWLIALLLCALLNYPALSDVTVDPFGFAVVSDAGDSHEMEMILANNGNDEVEFSLVLMPQVLDEEDRMFPGRDDRSDPDEAGYEWRDGEEDDCPPYAWIDISDFDDVEDIEHLADDSSAGEFEFGFTLEYYGNEFDQIAIFPNGMAVLGEDPGDIIYFYPISQWQEDLPTDYSDGGDTPTPPPNLLCVNFQDLNPSVAGHIYFWSDRTMAVCTWEDVPHFVDAQAEGDLWTFQVVIYASGLIKYQIAETGEYDGEDVMIGFQNQDRDLGFTVMRNDFDYLEAEGVVAFGPEEAWITWAEVDPISGEIPRGEEEIITVTFNTENIETGLYYAQLAINVDDPAEEAPYTIRIPLLLSVESPVGAIEGTVTDALNDEAIEGVPVMLEPFGLMRLTDDQGSYEMANIPVGDEYRLTCTVPDYLPFVLEDVEVTEDEATDGSMALLHAECNPSRDVIRVILPADEDMHVEFEVSNNGNGDLEYIVERRLLGGANAEPGDLRESIVLGEALEDIRLEGAVFNGQYFYVSGANVWNREDGPNMIYVVNRDGEMVNEFEQAGESHYGMRDLAWDGELIWGSGERNIYGFTPDGEVLDTIIGPYDNNRALAWDPDRNLMWACGTTSPLIVGVTLEGEEEIELERNGLRIYGLAYWQDDPDGFQLYIYHYPGDDIHQMVHKIDPGEGDTMLVWASDPEVEGNAAGAFISNMFDVYSWVFISMVNDGSNDRMEVWQLAVRKDWMLIDPVDGIIEAEQSVGFDLHLDATGLSGVEMEAELTFIHNGIGGETVIPLTMNVIGVDNSPSAFNLLEPPDSSFVDCTDTITFAWEESIDPDDEVIYRIHFECNLFDTWVYNVLDTTFSIQPDTAGMNGGCVPLDMIWFVEAISGEDTTECNSRFLLSIQGGGCESENHTPYEFAIQAVYPNPFNAQTRISYSLNKAGNTQLRIYDFTGREITAVDLGRQSAGYYHTVVDAATLPSGVYIVHLIAGGEVRTAKLLCIK